MNDTEEMHREPDYLEVTCPCCGRTAPLTAVAERVDYARLPVTVDRGGEPGLDWGSVDMQADLVYCCGFCDAVLAYDMDGVRALAASVRQPDGEAR